MTYHKLVVIVEDEEGRHHLVLLSGTEADQVSELIHKLYPHGLKSIRLNSDLVYREPWYSKLLNYIHL